MDISKDILYDQLRLAVIVSDVADDRIRFGIVGEDFDVDANHIVYGFNLESKVPLDLLSTVFMYTYGINVIIISKDVEKIAQLQEEIRSQMESYYTHYDIQSVGDTDILKDEELDVFSSNIQFQIVFN